MEGYVVGDGGCRLFSPPHLFAQFGLARGKEAVSGGAFTKLSLLLSIPFASTNSLRLFQPLPSAIAIANRIGLVRIRHHNRDGEQLLANETSPASSTSAV